ncbi:MAG: hypothetical protein JSV12_06935 [Candidatus Bathyarchaeota archaeon]|nr:MAG: hypothetical protein JSV12_06935 [Candidatus Bathyarchaeota archaeon]
MEFPERVYTIEEVQKARELIEKGYMHHLDVRGSPEFKRKVEEALNLVKTAKYYDFLRTYIKQIVEIDGLTQLRESEVAIWASMYIVADPVDAASLFIQKAQQMKDFIEGRLYYETGEMRTVKKRIEFLETLKETSKDLDVKKKCEELLKSWTETTFP